jgi:hypothetical protein
MIGGPGLAVIDEDIDPVGKKGSLGGSPNGIARCKSRGLASPPLNR